MLVFTHFASEGQIEKHFPQCLFCFAATNLKLIIIVSVVVIDSLLAHSYQTLASPPPTPPFLRALHSAAEVRIVFFKMSI